MTYPIEKIEGIGPAFAAKLAEAGITDTAALLEKGGAANGRKAVAQQTEISEKLILEWANLADLMRINGVGEEYADLMEEAGVDTTKELATRNAENLAAKMAEVNEEKNLTNAVPNTAAVQGWIDQAKELEPVISH